MVMVMSNLYCSYLGQYSYCDPTVLYAEIQNDLFWKGDLNVMENPKGFRCIKSTLSRREESLQITVAYEQALVLLSLHTHVRQSLRKRKAT